MSAEDYIAELLAAAPPLTPAVRDQLAALLCADVDGPAEKAA